MQKRIALNTTEVPAKVANIIEEKRYSLSSETALGRYNEQQLLIQAAALRSAANSILITDRRGSIIWTNPAFSALTGYAPEEVVGRNPKLLKSGCHDRTFYQGLWKTVLSGQTWRGEFTNRRKDGTHYFGEQVITPVKSEQGEITHFIGIMNDVTQRKRAEEDLRQTNEKYRHLLQHSPAIFYTLRIEGQKLTPSIVSENVSNLLGYPAREACTYEWWVKSLHPDDRARVLETVMSGMKGSGYVTKYRIRHKDGSYRWFQDNNRVLRNSDGVVIEAVGVWADITESKRAEDALRESEERYRDLFDNAHDLIQTVSADGSFLYVNRAWRNTLGYAEAEVPKLRLLNIIPPDVKEHCQALFAKTLAGEPIKLLQTEFLSKDGRRVALEGSVSPKLENGKVVSLRCIFRDITEKKKLEAQFLRNQRMESLGTLAGGIAHDLNNVLTPVLLSLQLLKLKFSDEDSTDLLNTLEASTKRGAEMVKQVLTFSRGFEGKRVEVQLQHLVKELKNIIGQTFPKNVRIKCDIDKDLWTVAGDATQLHQVLLNLCVNARDAMPQGGSLAITAENVSLDEAFSRMNPNAKPGPHVVLTVSDTGTGMTPDVREKIFDPFFTTKPLGQGTGLGLSTTQGIVKSHGGFISVYTELAKGSVFKVYLPAKTASHREAALQALAAVPAGKGEMILLVDDEAAVRSIAQQTLEMYGYRVLVAVDGAQAVAIIAQNAGKIALMLTDLTMPVMDGHAAIRAVRTIDPKLKIIAATGLTNETSASDAGEENAYPVLHKPYTAERLLKTIRENLDI